MDKASKDIALAYKYLQLAKLEITRLCVLGRPHDIPEDTKKLLSELKIR